jgi:hypothetical protein
MRSGTCCGSSGRRCRRARSVRSSVRSCPLRPANRCPDPIPAASILEREATVRPPPDARRRTQARVPSRIDMSGVGPRRVPTAGALTHLQAPAGRRVPRSEREFAGPSGTSGDPEPDDRQCARPRSGATVISGEGLRTRGVASPSTLRSMPACRFGALARWRSRRSHPSSPRHVRRPDATGERSRAQLTRWGLTASVGRASLTA